MIEVWTLNRSDYLAFHPWDLVLSERERSGAGEEGVAEGEMKRRRDGEKEESCFEQQLLSTFTPNSCRPAGFSDSPISDKTFDV